MLVLSSSQVNARSPCPLRGVLLLGLRARRQANRGAEPDRGAPVSQVLILTPSGHRWQVVTVPTSVQTPAFGSSVV